MNIINKLFLKLALLPAPLYRSTGVDIAQLQTILATKLTMDDRRPNTFHQTSKRKKDTPISFATVGTMLMSALLGIFYLSAFFLGNSMVTQLTFYFSFFFFMLAATMVSDFTSVLIDVRDTFIILPKPVSDRTFVAARLLHIFIHISKLVLPMVLPGLVYTAVLYGFSGCLYLLLMVILLTLFTIFFINALYLLILKVTTPQKFQAIISYVQIGFAILIYGSYQVVPRLLGPLGNIQINLAEKSYSAFIPPFWFASGWTTFYNLTATTPEFIGCICSIIIPIASLIIVIKYLAPSFNQKLAMISASSKEETKERKVVTERKNKEGISTKLSRLLTKSPAEQTGFLFTWKMTSRSRDFKLKVYPAIGYFAVYALIMLLNKKTVDVSDVVNQNSTGKFIVITALYFSSLIVIMAISQITYSEKHKAGWLYFVPPVQKPGEVISGSIKAAMAKFFAPVAVLFFLAGVVFVGAQVIPNVLLGTLNIVLIVSVIAYVSHRQLPFSKPQSNNEKVGSFIKGIVMLACTLVIGTLHYLIYEFIYVIILFALISITGIWYVWGSIKNTSWEKLSRLSKD